jgi:hypothetical protein
MYNTKRQLAGEYYQNRLSVTEVARPLSHEYGDDDSVLINIINPALKTDNETPNEVDILYGDKDAQFNRILPGNASGLLPVTPVSSIWIRTAGAGQETRIAYEVYK